MAAHKILNPCEGSGISVMFGQPQPGQTAVCPICNLRCNITKYGNLRKHEDRSTIRLKDVIAARRPEWEEDQPPPAPTLKEMRDDATKLKTSLWTYYQISKDPNYKRLWQHALALETHLGNLHDNQAFGAASVSLMAYRTQ